MSYKTSIPILLALVLVGAFWFLSESEEIDYGRQDDGFQLVDEGVYEDVYGNTVRVLTFEDGLFIEQITTPDGELLSVQRVNPNS